MPEPALREPATALPPTLDPHRLAALDALDLLDTEAEAAFDRITELASLTLGVPIAMINLVDGDRQYVKSAVGRPQQFRAGCNVPLGTSICRHAVDSGRPLVIPDARSEPLVADNRAVTELGVAAYAGMPLVTPDGHALGALCAIDTAPRHWSARDLEVLGGLARTVMSEIARRSARVAERRRREEVEQTAQATATRLRLVRNALDASEGRLRASRADTVARLCRATELRSEETGAHIAAMSDLCGRLARRLGLSQERAEMVGQASSLHDVGKIAIPDAILHKAGPLTPDERAVIQTHAEIGHDMLTGSDDPLLDLAAQIALTHHERMDGDGYPAGLSGEQIPLPGRIAAVADVFDALTSTRSYRAAIPEGRALAIMEEERGTHFDAKVLDALVAEVALRSAAAEAAATEVALPVGASRAEGPRRPLGAPWDRQPLLRERSPALRTNVPDRRRAPAHE